VSEGRGRGGKGGTTSSTEQARQKAKRPGGKRGKNSSIILLLLKESPHLEGKGELREGDFRPQIRQKTIGGKERRDSTEIGRRASFRLGQSAKRVYFAGGGGREKGGANLLIISGKKNVRERLREKSPQLYYLQ